MLKVACLCLLVLAVCGPVILARNYFERCFDAYVVVLTDFAVNYRALYDTIGV